MKLVEAPLEEQAGTAGLRRGRSDAGAGPDALDRETRRFEVNSTTVPCTATFTRSSSALETCWRGYHLCVLLPEDLEKKARAENDQEDGPVDVPVQAHESKDVEQPDQR